MTTLMPRADGRYLDPTEVSSRVNAAFAYVETSTEGARKQVLEWMNQLAFVAAEGRAAAYDDYLAQLERFQDAARFVHCGDDLGSDGVLISMLMIPRQPLIIEHLSHVHEEEGKALIVRCAAALGYEIVAEESMVEKAAPDPAYGTLCACAA